VRVLFDQGAPVPLRRHLAGHDVATAFELGWGAFNNGDLLTQAEAAGFDALLTTDRNLRYQQNLDGRRIAIVVLSTTSWPRISRATERVRAALSEIGVGGYIEIEIA
jgi:hypothetical protein